MRAANVMVSKLGGLTTFEAFACRLPIIADLITPPMPQEAGAASFIEKRGAGIMLRKASDVVPIVRKMLEDTRHYAQLRAATVGLAIPGSTRHIVEEIAALIPSPVMAREEPVLVEARSS
jgi:UDP-N-acetylglucosamine:LPS N-acetylglucosamine transferase